MSQQPEPEVNPLVHVDHVQRNLDWVSQWEDWMHDEEFQEALDYAIKIIAKPNVPQPKVAALCVRLEAYNVLFRLRFNEFMMWKKGTKDAAAKKNAYKEMITGIDNLVAALKYLIRNDG